MRSQSFVNPSHGIGLQSVVTSREEVHYKTHIVDEGQ